MFYTTNSQIESSLLSLRKLVSETRKRTTSPQTSTTNLDLGTCEKLWLLLLFSFSFPLPLLYEVKKRKWKEIKRLKDICRKKKLNHIPWVDVTKIQVWGEDQSSGRRAKVNEDFVCFGNSERERGSVAYPFHEFTIFTVNCLLYLYRICWGELYFLSNSCFIYIL